MPSFGKESYASRVNRAQEWLWTVPIPVPPSKLYLKQNMKLQTQNVVLLIRLTIAVKQNW